jgi:hypothetical protein
MQLRNGKTTIFIAPSKVTIEQETNLDLEALSLEKEISNSSMQLRNGKLIEIIVSHHNEIKKREEDEVLQEPVNEVIIVDNSLLEENSCSSCQKEETKNVSIENPDDVLLKQLVNLNKKNIKDINKFYEISKNYDKFRKSKEIKSLEKNEALNASLKLASEVVDIGTQIIISLFCWLGEPDIIKGLRHYYPKLTIEYQIHLLRIVYILDRIRERYVDNNLELHDRTQEIVKNCIEFLKSFGPHILWVKKINN